jgi:hypothetical protein
MVLVSLPPWMHLFNISSSLLGKVSIGSERTKDAIGVLIPAPLVGLQWVVLCRGLDERVAQMAVSANHDGIGAPSSLEAFVQDISSSPLD